MMDSSAMNDFFAFVPGGDLFPGLHSPHPSAFKLLPQSQGFPPLTNAMSHCSGYSSVMHNKVPSTMVPSMPVTFSSVKSTPPRTSQNANNGSLGRNMFPLNRQWHWNITAPKPSNWPDTSPPRYPALYTPPNQMADDAGQSPTDMNDMQPFFSTPGFVPERTNLLMSTSAIDQDGSSEMQRIAALRRSSLDSLSSLQLPDPFEDMGSKTSSPSAPRSSASSDHESSTRSSPNPPNSTAPPSPQARPKKKTPKMHSCPICQRAFPRPSGLQVHLNSHNGLKPFTCEFPSCDRKFTVRSNARRHLRTHGVAVVSSDGDKQSTGSHAGTNPDTPSSKKAEVNDKNSKVLRWIPHSLSGGTHASSARDESISSGPDSNVESLTQPSNHHDL